DLRLCRRREPRELVDQIGIGVPLLALPADHPVERAELLQRLPQVPPHAPARLRDGDQIVRSTESALETRIRRLTTHVDGVLLAEGLGQGVETAEDGIEAGQRLRETARR